MKFIVLGLLTFIALIIVISNGADGQTTSPMWDAKYVQITTCGTEGITEPLPGFPGITFTLTKTSDGAILCISGAKILLALNITLNTTGTSSGMGIDSTADFTQFKVNWFIVPDFSACKNQSKGEEELLLENGPSVARVTYEEAIATIPLIADVCFGLNNTASVPYFAFLKLTLNTNITATATAPIASTIDLSKLL